MIQPMTAAEAVAQGAQLLDEKMPGWWRRLSLNTFNIEQCDSCICGQLALASYDEVMRGEIMKGKESYTNNYYEYYWHFLHNELDLETDRNHGFAVPYDKETGEDCFTWDELEKEWENVILARLEADKLAAETPVETREKVIA